MVLKYIVLCLLIILGPEIYIYLLVYNSGPEKYKIVDFVVLVLKTINMY